MASRVSRGQNVGFDVAVYGLKETDRALKALAPDLRREMYVGIKRALNRVVTEARANVPSQSPMSGWRSVSAARPTSSRGGSGWAPWNSAEIASGIKQVGGKSASSGLRPNVGRVSFALRSESAAGAIFEQAGRKSRGTGSGVSFIRTLESRNGKASRLLWRAYLSQQMKVYAEVKEAVDKAENALVDRVNDKMAGA